LAEARETRPDPALEEPRRPPSADMPIAGLEAARLELRQSGYCVLCDRMIVREPDGACPAGHPAEAVFGVTMLGAGEGPQQLPRFNLGAFLVPFLWGPGHGQWVGAFFLPIWLFMDSIIRSAIDGPPVLKAAATFVVVATVAFEAHFATRANGMAWRRVCDRMTVDEFVRKERWWAVAMVPLFVMFVAWAVWFDVVMR
jgi:hypothetical protein